MTYSRQVVSRMKAAREKYGLKQKGKNSKVVVKLANNILQMDNDDNTMLLHPESSYHTGMSLREGTANGFHIITQPRSLNEDLPKF